MGVCGSKDNSSLDRPGQGVLTVWGDYFSPETRTILTMLTLGQVKHEFQAVDQFKGEHRKDQYLAINPTGSLPTITEGRFLILGGYLVFLTYLANHHKAIREKL